LAVEAIHVDQIREHGGVPGLRDEGLLEAALARPRQQWAYRKSPDLTSLAAAYAYGLARNHPFRDGNKRIAFLTAVVFLGLNGLDLAAPEAEVVERTVKLAAGSLTEARYARWLRSRIEPA
jgi:death-on-curing protein